MENKEVFYGTVIWFRRGIGFLSPDDGSSDKFVHYSNIVAPEGAYKTLVAGQRVSFVIGANKNGPQAEMVTVIAEPDVE